MRKQDPREATKRAAKRDAHKLKTRLSQREKRKRKATVAAVYSLERQVRTSGSRCARPDPSGGWKVRRRKHPVLRARHNRGWASVERGRDGRKTAPKQLDQAQPLLGR